MAVQWIGCILVGLLAQASSMCPSSCRCVYLAGLASCRGSLSDDDITLLCTFAEDLDLRLTTVTASNLDQLATRCPRLRDLELEPVEGSCPTLPVRVTCGGSTYGAPPDRRPAPADDGVPPVDGAEPDVEPDDAVTISSASSVTGLIIVVILAVVVYYCCRRHREYRRREPPVFAVELAEIRRGARARGTHDRAALRREHPRGERGRAPRPLGPDAVLRHPRSGDVRGRGQCPRRRLGSSGAAGLVSHADPGGDHR